MTTTAQQLVTLGDVLHAHGINAAGLKERVLCNVDNHRRAMIYKSCAKCDLRYSCVVTYLWACSQLQGFCQNCPDLEACRKIYDERC